MALRSPSPRLRTTFSSGKSSSDSEDENMRRCYHCGKF
jgi:hypothetical protein